VSAATWPAADERLVRCYRRLLLAYSGRYRRLHGAEMLTTILEMAEPTRSRPSAGEAWHLIGSGVRQRFRLPSGRPFTSITAVLVTLVLGVLGAAAGSWLAVSMSTDLPARPEALKLVNPAVTDPTAGFVDRFSWSGRADSLSFYVSPKAQQPGWTVEDARTGLTAAGWTVTEFTVHPRPASIICTAYLPLAVTGGLLGALAGWLLTAALAYRIRSLPPGSGRLAAAFTGVAVITAAPPVWAIIVNAVMLGQHLTYNGPVYTLHAALRPYSHLDGVPAWLIPACTIAAAAAAAIAVGILVPGTDHEELPGATQPT
jgi:hypothetical protein